MNYETKHFYAATESNYFFIYFIFSTWGSFEIFTPPMDFSSPPDRPRTDPLIRPDRPRTDPVDISLRSDENTIKLFKRLFELIFSKN